MSSVAEKIKQGKADYNVAMIPFLFSEREEDHARSGWEKLSNWLLSSKEEKLLFSHCSNGYYPTFAAKAGFDVFAYEPNEAVFSEIVAHWDRGERNPVWLDSLDTRTDFFDRIFHMGFSFGDEQNWDALLDRYLACLKPGGTLVLELIGRDLLEKYFHEKYWIELEEGTFLLNQRSVDYQEGDLQEEFVLIDCISPKHFFYTKKIFYPFEIMELLKKKGFKDEKYYGNLAGGEYGDSSELLLATARKPLTSQQSFIKC